MERETTRRVGAATMLLIRMHYIFTTGVIKATELLSILQKKQEKNLFE